jgi:hypothetical protein
MSLASIIVVRVSIRLDGDDEGNTSSRGTAMFSSQLLSNFVQFFLAC